MGWDHTPYTWGANNSWNGTYGWKEENLGFKNGKGSFKERHLNLSLTPRYCLWSVFTGLQMSVSYLNILGLFIDVAAGGTCLEMKVALFGLPTRRAR